MIVMSKMHLIATIVIGWSCGVDFMDARVGLRFALDLAQVWNNPAKQSVVGTRMHSTYSHDNGTTYTQQVSIGYVVFSVLVLAAILDMTRRGHWKREAAVAFVFSSIVAHLVCQHIQNSTSLCVFLRSRRIT